MLIGERVLTLSAAGRTFDVPVRIFAPERQKQAWSCQYEILWPDGQRTATAHGFDSIQAILAAMQMIGAELYTSDHHERGHLVWGEPGRGYGFPVTQSIRDLLAGDDARYL